ADAYRLHIVETEKFLAIGFIQLLQSTAENAFRQFLRAIDPDNRASNFAGICASLCRPTSPRCESDLGQALELLTLLRLVRNSIHNNGIFQPESGRSEQVTFRGQEYRFRVGSLIDFVSWKLLVDLADDLGLLFGRLVRDPALSSIESIPDPSAYRRPN